MAKKSKPIPDPFADTTWTNEFKKALSERRAWIEQKDKEFDRTILDKKAKEMAEMDEWLSKKGDKPFDPALSYKRQGKSHTVPVVQGKYYTGSVREKGGLIDTTKLDPIVSRAIIAHRRFPMNHRSAAQFTGVDIQEYYRILERNDVLEILARNQQVSISPYELDARMQEILEKGKRETAKLAAAKILYNRQGIDVDGKKDKTEVKVENTISFTDIVNEFKKKDPIEQEGSNA